MSISSRSSMRWADRAVRLETETFQKLLCFLCFHFMRFGGSLGIGLLEKPFQPFLQDGRKRLGALLGFREIFDRAHEILGDLDRISPKGGEDREKGS